MTVFRLVGKKPQLFSQVSEFSPFAYTDILRPLSYQSDPSMEDEQSIASPETLNVVNTLDISLN